MTTKENMESLRITHEWTQEKEETIMEKEKDLTVGQWEKKIKDEKNQWTRRVVEETWLERKKEAKAV